MKPQIFPDIKVGETALVLCVKAIFYNEKQKANKIHPALPILPYEPHEDADVLDFPAKHYHCDWRFWSNQLIQELFEDSIFNFEQSLHFRNQSIFDSPEDWPPTVIPVDTIVEEPFQIEMICQREMPFLAPHYTFLRSLEYAYENQTLSKEFICPHRGFLTFPDSSCPGRRICPGHGLGWDKKGQLYKRFAP